MQLRREISSSSVLRKSQEKRFSFLFFLLTYLLKQSVVEGLTRIRILSRGRKIDGNFVAFEVNKKRKEMKSYKGEDRD